MRYNNLDVAKLFMAFCVVAIHVAALSSYTMPHVLDFVVRLAVPFFLIATGFFIYPKLFSPNNPPRGKILFKYIKMYLIWTAVYLPFAILYYMQIDLSFVDAVDDYLSSFILTGETPLAWHLLYLHSLIVSLVVIIILSYSKISIELLSFIVFVLSFILDLLIAFDVPLFKGLISYLGNYQNFIMTGLPALCLGGLINKYYKTVELLLKPVAIIAVVLISLGLYIAKCHSYCILFSGLLFVVLMSSQQIRINASGLIRESSKYVFFLHLLVAFMLRGRIDNIFLYWLVVVVISLMISCCLYCFQMMVANKSARVTKDE